MSADWTTIKPAPHEFGGHLIYASHGLSPYYAMDSRIKEGGGSVSANIRIDGEPWSVTLSYQDSSLLPWDAEQYELDTVKQFKLSFRMQDEVGKRGGVAQIAPRWPDQKSEAGCDDPSTPGDLVGIDAHVQGSNIELEEYPKLLQRAFEALDLNVSYVTDPHEYSSIYKFERYLRIERDATERIICSGGAIERVFEAASNEGKFRELREDDGKIEGYHHRVGTDSRAAADLIDGHHLAKRVKHYHPEHPRKDPSDPLYHPKLGARLFKKQNADGSVKWSSRNSLERELDESVLNIAHWAGLRVDPAGPFVTDEYFGATECSDRRSIVDDPTPEIRREQDAVVAGHMMSMTESDQDAMEVMADGGVPTVEELAAEAGWSKRTIYRVLDRLDDVLSLQNGDVRFLSEHLEQRVRDSIGAAKRAVDHDTDAGESSWSRWRNRFGVDVDDRGARLVMRFGRVGDALDLREALKDGLRAWRKAGRDPAAYRKAQIEFERDGFQQVQMGFEPAH